jgi:hypothetical protein
MTHSSHVPLFVFIVYGLPGRLLVSFLAFLFLFFNERPRGPGAESVGIVPQIYPVRIVRGWFLDIGTVCTTLWAIAWLKDLGIFVALSIDSAIVGYLRLQYKICYIMYNGLFPMCFYSPVLARFLSSL